VKNGHYSRPEEMMDQQSGSEQGEEHRCRHDYRPPVRAGLNGLCRIANVRTAGGVEGVFGYDAIFVEPQVPRDRSDEAAIECSPGQLVPPVILNCFQESCADACGGGNFVEGNSAHFAFALEVFAERCGGHFPGDLRKI
jgi:hypothetical protein